MTNYGLEIIGAALGGGKERHEGHISSSTVIIIICRGGTAWRHRRESGLLVGAGDAFPSPPLPAGWSFFAFARTHGRPEEPADRRDTSGTPPPHISGCECVIVVVAVVGAAWPAADQRNLIVVFWWVAKGPSVRPSAPPSAGPIKAPI
ncbi:hypothetical protein niasHT_023603 [Heterodera trifolii]|uniref:Uncharacterized protein n=1 Tax=Heterodera trifolii TaxID=157864 RepID=A0ABD2JK89_9BILA